MQFKNEKDLYLSLYLTIPESFKGISKVKNKSLIAESKKKLY